MKINERAFLYVLNTILLVFVVFLGFMLHQYEDANMFLRNSKSEWYRKCDSLFWQYDSLLDENYDLKIKLLEMECDNEVQ